MMNLTLTDKATNDIKHDFLKVLTSFLEHYDQRPPSKTGLINANEVKEELGISSSTLQRWEKQGLQRYHAPLDGGKIRLYRITDLLRFLGVEAA